MERKNSGGGCVGLGGGTNHSKARGDGVVSSVGHHRNEEEGSEIKVYCKGHD